MVMAHIAVPYGEVDPLHFWTLQDLAQLPEDSRRYEIVDGQLMMVPSPSLGHQDVAKRLVRVLTEGFGADYKVLESVALDIAPTFRIPDVMVFDFSAYSPRALSVSPQDVALVVEVVSPGSRTNDRITKPAEYAAAGIGAYWRVETEPSVSVTAYVLDEGASTYRQLDTWAEGEVMELDAPVPIRVVVAELGP